MNARVLLPLTLLLVPHLANAQDPCTSSSSELMSAVNKTTSAFSAGNQELFQSARDEARRALTCLDEPLAPASAAAYHRMEALAAFFDRDKDWCLASFRAALTIQPAYRLDTSIAPEGGPLDGWYQEAQEFPDISFDELDPPPHCSLLLDGSTEAERHEELPVIAQVLESDGSVRWSGLLQPGQLIDEEAYSHEYEPVWPPRIEIVQPIDPVIDGDTPAPKPTVSPLWFGAGGAALAAGGLYAASWASRAKWQTKMDDCVAGGCWDDPQGAYDDSEALRTRTNTLAWAAGGAGVVTLGLTVGAVLTVEW